MLTRKHFEETAAILRENWESAEYLNDDLAAIHLDRTKRLANQFATWFNSDNPHFDREKFMKAIFD